MPVVRKRSSPLNAGNSSMRAGNRPKQRWEIVAAEEAAEIRKKEDAQYRALEKLKRMVEQDRAARQAKTPRSPRSDRSKPRDERVKSAREALYGPEKSQVKKRAKRRKASTAFVALDREASDDG